MCFSCRSTNVAISAHSGCPASDASGSAHACSHCANAGSGQIHICCCPGNSISYGRNDTAEFHPWGWCKFLLPEFLSFAKTVYLSRLPVNMVLNWLSWLNCWFILWFMNVNHHGIWQQSAVIQLGVQHFHQRSSTCSVLIFLTAMKMCWQLALLFSF